MHGDIRHHNSSLQCDNFIRKNTKKANKEGEDGGGKTMDGRTVQFTEKKTISSFSLFGWKMGKGKRSKALNGLKQFRQQQ